MGRSMDGIGIGVNGVKGFGFKDGNASIHYHVLVRWLGLLGGAVMLLALFDI